MRCARCGSDNPDDKRFCGDCGAPLALHCPTCGAENPSDKKFCGDCGASRVQTPDARGAADAPAPATAGQSSGERRHLTVLFCDLVDSTAIAARLDPEDWRAAVGAYHHSRNRIMSNVSAGRTGVASTCSSAAFSRRRVAGVSPPNACSCSR
jgi:Double zinc ribbon